MVYDRNKQPVTDAEYKGFVVISELTPEELPGGAFSGGPEYGVTAVLPAKIPEKFAPLVGAPLYTQVSDFSSLSPDLRASAVGGTLGVRSVLQYPHVAEVRDYLEVQYVPEGFPARVIHIIPSAPGETEDKVLAQLGLTPSERSKGKTTPDYSSLRTALTTMVSPTEMAKLCTPSAQRAMGLPATATVNDVVDYIPALDALSVADSPRGSTGVTLLTALRYILGVTPYSVVNSWVFPGRVVLTRDRTKEV